MSDRRQLAAAARGDYPLDLALLNVHLINVLTGEIYASDIGICENRIALVGRAGEHTLDARMVIDGSGLWAAPGFIDGHVHNESSMVTPARWTEVILPHGTTTVCTDPHEIANVLGLKGVRYMLDASHSLPIRYYVTVPSCVPAVPHLESAGAAISAADVAEMLRWERVIGIAEAMDYVGLANQSGEITPIVQAGHRAGMPIEGHAPGVTGRTLQAYLAAAGPRATDHESISGANMLAKAQAGMMVYAKVTTPSGKRADEIASAVKQMNDTRMFGFCTDDNMPNHILNNGHLDFGMRAVIAQGISPLTAIQMATINVAQHYGLWGLGAIAPGWLADLVLLDDLEKVQVRHVITDGKIRVKDGQLIQPIPEPLPPLLDNSVCLPEDLTPESFILKVKSRADTVTLNGIDLSRPPFTRLKTLQVPCQNGRVKFPLPEELTMATIVARHGQGTSPSLVLLSGYPLRSGALASTISHDSHNLTIIGQDPADMLLAARTLEECGGGLVAVKKGQVLAKVALPIAGLMSPLTATQVGEQLTHLEQSLPALGLPPTFPGILIGLALPVIPQVRLTDLGLVDVKAQQFLPLEV